VQLGSKSRWSIGVEMSPIFSATAVAAMVLLAVWTSTARVEPMPQPKFGRCPSGYRESGGYCAPTNERAPAAISEDRTVSVELDAERRLLRRDAAALTSITACQSLSAMELLFLEPYPCPSRASTTTFPSAT
jgi:hypothetical protein